eukprot:jgi/Chrzof1/11158/Cz05g26030.t1
MTSLTTSAKLMCLPYCTCYHQRANRVLLALGSGQGLKLNTTRSLAASSASSTLQRLYQSSKAWKSAFKLHPKVSCKGSGGTLCAARTNNSQEYAQLVLATSPYRYDSRSLKDVGSYSPLDVCRDQGDCSTCVGFAVTAACQAAIASVLQVNGTSIPAFSVQDLQLCSGGSQVCSSGSFMIDPLRQIKQRNITTESCLPYQADVTNTLPKCMYQCSSDKRNSTYAGLGTFGFVQLREAWEVQQHIRQYGGVLTSLIINVTHLRDFYNDNNSSAVYDAPQFENLTDKGEGHAVLLVGYDNEERYWIVRNSWGPDWADKGYFKCSMDAPGLLVSENTYGVTWQLSKPKSPPALGPLGTRGCYTYVAQKSDYLSKVAATYGMVVNRLLLDNIDIITSLDDPLSGTQLKLCGIESQADTLKRQVYNAWRNNSLGLSFTYATMLTAYDLGVVDQLANMGVITLGRVKAAGVGFGALWAVGVASNVSVPYLFQYYNLGKALCKASQNCFGTADKQWFVLAQSYISTYPPIRQAVARKGKAASVLLSVGDPECSDDESVAKPTLVSEFNDVDDLLDTLRASVYRPILSGSNMTTTWRGKAACTGYFADHHPCPPDVGYCIKISPFPYPDYSPNVEKVFATRLIGKLLQKVNITLADLLTDTSMNVKNIPEQQKAPSLATVASILAGDRTRGLPSIGIAPNIYYKLPITESRNWWDGIGVVLEDAADEFLWDLGHTDAKAWADVMGVGVRGGAQGKTWRTVKTLLKEAAQGG